MEKLSSIATLLKQAQGITAGKVRQAMLSRLSNVEALFPQLENDPGLRLAIAKKLQGMGQWGDSSFNFYNVPSLSDNIVKRYSDSIKGKTREELKNMLAWRSLFSAMPRYFKGYDSFADNHRLPSFLPQWAVENAGGHNRDAIKLAKEHFARKDVENTNAIKNFVMQLRNSLQNIGG